MRKKLGIGRKIISLAASLVLTVGAVTLSAPQAVQAASGGHHGIQLDCEDKTFLGMKPWYHGLCGHEVEISEFISTIFTNVISILLNVVGMVSIAFVIYAGILMMTAQGNSGRMASARDTLIKALAGLIIALFANGIITLIQNRAGIK